MTGITLGIKMDKVDGCKRIARTDNKTREHRTRRRSDSKGDEQ